MNKIQSVIDRVVSGQFALETQPGYCLRAARQVVEEANGWKERELFERMKIYQHFTQTNRKRAPTVPWARSLEQTFIDQHMTVPVAQARAGDLAFSRQPADMGHIGPIGIGPDGKLWVLENAEVRRGQHLRGALNWVPLAQWTGLTTVGRLPDAWVFGPDPKPETTSPPRVLLVPKGGGEPLAWNGKAAVFGGTALSAGLVEQLRTVYPRGTGPHAYEQLRVWHRKNGELVLERTT